ncbi:Alpha-N-acetylgalactosamine-specific lectin [Apostichopus japonicus]|uniref:Alpha-N-acetylgalactosamine-specific lectin n=1 Tax=Stichopus japonicus TaxID=307972 RepID=A0A2G8L4Z7_STIJA|nr:Alpha-N-acetylgalactosamine-specific lectin [Apostichopus japonicus]
MKVYIFLLCVALCIAGGVATCCPPYWTVHGDHCYRYFGFPRRYVVAEYFCNQFSSCSGDLAHLASSETEKENDFLYRYIESLSAELPPEAAWIGLNDIAVEGEYVWTDNSVSPFRSWATGQPGPADCGAMPGEFPTSTWVMLPCGEPLPYICKMRREAPPQTAQPGVYSARYFQHSH